MFAKEVRAEARAQTREWKACFAEEHTTRRGLPKVLVDLPLVEGGGMGLDRERVIEIALTLAVALMNLAVTLAVMRKEFRKRVPYMGQEMAYLALGLVVTRLSGSTGVARDAIFLCIVVFLVLDVLVLAATNIIVERQEPHRNPLVALTAAVGVILVYLAISDWMVVVVQGYLREVPQ